MKITIILLSLIFSSMSFAKVGITMGGNNSKYSSSGDSTTIYDSSIGYDIGLMYNFEIASMLAVALQLGYVTHKTAISFTNNPGLKGDMLFSYYVIRPLLLLDLVGDFGIFAGGTYGINNKAKSEYSDSFENVDYNSSGAYTVKKNRIAANIGLHYVIPLGALELRTRFMYEKGFGKIMKSNDGIELEIDTYTASVDILL